MRTSSPIAVILLAALLCASSGCVSTPGGRGSRLLPWNWFSSDSTSQVEKAEKREEQADNTLRTEAQRMAEATKLAIAAEKARQLAEGGVSRELTTAEDYAGRTVSLLNASEGFLAFDVQAELAEMVRLRNSQVQAERARGDKLLAGADKIAERAATLKIKAARELAIANGKVAAEQQRALVAEEKYNRTWFWILVGLGVYALLQLLPLLAKAFPAIGPLSTAAGMILSPVAQATLGKMKKVTGELIHTVESGAAISANAIRERFDGPLSEHDQSDIAKAYAAARSK